MSDWLSGDGITGTWGGLHRKLIDRGFEFIGSYDAEVWGNTKGGLESGSVYTGLLDFGLKLDLEKAFGWPGASLSTTWLLLSGKNASNELVGNFLTISNNAGFNTLRNYELWFQQNLLDEKISIRLGQVAGDTEFVISDYAALFLNGTFGWPAFMYMNLPEGRPGFPVGTLEMRLAVQPVKWFRFQTAVFRGNVYAQNVNLHGFRWRLDGQNGFFFLDERNSVGTGVLKKRACRANSKSARGSIPQSLRSPMVAASFVEITVSISSLIRCFIVNRLTCLDTSPPTAKMTKAP
jgi:carbohydrate-selective porin OprB